VKEDLLERLEAKIEASQAKTDMKLKKMIEEIKCGPAEMRSIVNAWIVDMEKGRKETMSCQVTTATCLDSKELNPEDMKSEVVHREDPTARADIQLQGDAESQRD
jgi:hypothetical protein